MMAGLIQVGIMWKQLRNAFALEGNGWYCDSLIDKAFEHKLITSEDTRYQLKATMSLKSNHFNKFVFRRFC